MENTHGKADATASLPNTDATGYDEGALAVKVAVHIRPLIGNELLQGCKDCVSLVPGEPQVQISNHSFTFDHVYGSTGSTSSSIFDECVSPLVDGLFQGYNATVLAYGQTGSGKTYTMGTGYTVGGSSNGVIPKVMDMIFNKVTTLKGKAEFQIRVSFIEILKEEVHDLLDPNPPIAIKCDAINGVVSKTVTPGKPQIQIRENTNGEITLAGVSELGVDSLEEMAACLERGSLCRATASTNMNTRSSRSHAIFTITLEQRGLIELQTKVDGNYNEDGSDDFLCAKLHLVDLAGSERAKRTGADGVRFKEGVHINKGLLALGNVISALGDDKKRKEGGHIPYRDSKLTRLLQDSLGGNSRTVMIACISPADSNAEETLNTLKYANRARNIQNKPVVNRDPMAAEMQRMRHQVELLQAELLCIREGSSIEEMQILKQRTAWFEASILELKQELKLARENLHRGAQRLLETQVERDKLQLKLDMLQSGKSWEEACGEDSQSTGLLESYAEQIRKLENEIHQLQSGSSALCTGQGQYRRSVSVLDEDVSMFCVSVIPETTKIEEETVEKEMEHALLQDSLDKELEELSKKLEQKEAEMKNFMKSDGVVLKHHFEKKILELEEEKNALQTERDMLVSQLTRLANTSDEQSHKLHETYVQKVKALETQISELKKRQENQTQLLKQKQRSDEAAKRLQEEIQKIKSQKVQLQNKIKQESEQFRSWKALREKELLQLKKEGRRNEYEMHKLQGLHQRQKMVLQRKTEECAAATRRLHELLERRKALSKENLGTGASASNGFSQQTSEKSLKQSIDDELEVAAHIHEVRSNYEKQSEIRGALAKELANLKQEPEGSGSTSKFSLSPGARQAKISLLESMLNASSSTLVAMASQLSEAEERERTFSARARWQHVRSMADAKSLLQYVLSSAVEARCKIWDKEVECKELKEKISELTLLLKKSEDDRRERQHLQYAKDKHIAKLLASSANIGTIAAMRACLDEISKSLLPFDEVGPRQLKYPDDSPEVSESDDSSSLRQSTSNGQRSEPDLTDIDVLEEEEESDMDLDIEDDASDEGSHPLKGKTRKLKRDKSQCMLSDSEKIDAESRTDSELCCSRGLSCKTNKCANREHVSKGVDTIEIAEALEMLTLDKEIRYAQISQPNECNETDGDVVLKKEDVQRAEQVLAKHGAGMLEDIWTDVGPPLPSSALWKERCLVSGVLGDKNHIRSPLLDIGNKTQAEQADEEGKSKQRKRWAKASMQTVTVQLVPTIEKRQKQPSNKIHNENQTLTENILEPNETSFQPSSNQNIIGRDIEASSNEKAIRNDADSDNARRIANGKCPIETSPTSPLLPLVGLQREDHQSVYHRGKMPRHKHPKKKKLSSPATPLRARNSSASEGFAPGTSTSSREQNKAISREKENV